MIEIWKDIPDYEGIYLASNTGKIKSIKRNRLLTPHKNRYGYLTLTLFKNNHKNTRSIHRLVASSFLGKSKLDVNHKDGIKTNNNIENLEFITRADNNRHAHKIGLQNNHCKMLSKKMLEQKTCL